MTSPIDPAGEDLDRKVPPKVMRLTQHLHNMIYIRFFYEQIGQQPPEWVKLEMGRAERHLTDELDREYQQGGAFRETRTSNERRPSGPEGRTETPRDVPDRSSPVREGSRGYDPRREPHFPELGREHPSRPGVQGSSPTHGEGHEVGEPGKTLRRV